MIEPMETVGRPVLKPRRMAAPGREQTGAPPASRQSVEALGQTAPTETIKGQLVSAGNTLGPLCQVFSR